MFSASAAARITSASAARLHQLLTRAIARLDRAEAALLTAAWAAATGAGREGTAREPRRRKGILPTAREPTVP
ncbi:MAG TPA: hypothetical protein VG674_09865 [Amycolatopsis sp.]|nr:hypothetical protein [Amycolatopsis sp.]